VIVGVRSRAARCRSTVFGYASILPFVFFALFPFYYMVITSLKRDAELYSLTAVPFLIETGVITDHYRYLFFKTDFWTWMTNSLIISVLATSVSLVISTLAGYSLARLRFPGVNSFGTAVFITYLVPPTLLFLPLSQVVARLGIADTIWSLIVTYPTFLVPFSTWLLMGYFRTIPASWRNAPWSTGPAACKPCSGSCCPWPSPGSSV
jgi:multiple sugar transport system permease protein